MIRRLAVERRPGLFHVTNQGAVSWFEFARAVLAAAGYDPARVEPILTADLVPTRPAPRPANSVLDNAALRAAGVPLLREFHEPLAALVHALRE
jgi:dTDP-4-dehydrorhamnose reductase